MVHRIYLLLIIVAYLSGAKNVAAQDSTSHSGYDTTSFNWPSDLGGDLFLHYEIYGFHLKGVGSLTSAEYLGVEVRFRPLFVGGMVGLSGDQGIRYVHPSRSLFSAYSFYAGVFFDDYRAEIGGTRGSDNWFVDNSPKDYTVGFLGISKRWSDIVFVEPEIKIMLPITAHYDLEPEYGQFITVTQHYSLKDLYFAIGVKVGIGYN